MRKYPLIEVSIPLPKQVFHRCERKKCISMTCLDIQYVAISTVKHFVGYKIINWPSVQILEMLHL